MPDIKPIALEPFNFETHPHHVEGWKVTGPALPANIPVLLARPMIHADASRALAVRLNLVARNANDEAVEFMRRAFPESSGYTHKTRPDPGVGDGKGWRIDISTPTIETGLALGAWAKDTGPRLVSETPTRKLLTRALTRAQTELSSEIHCLDPDQLAPAITPSREFDAFQLQVQLAAHLIPDQKPKLAENQRPIVKAAESTCDVSIVPAEPKVEVLEYAVASPDGAAKASLGSMLLSALRISPSVATTKHSALSRP